MSQHVALLFNLGVLKKCLLALGGGGGLPPASYGPAINTCLQNLAVWKHMKLLFGAYVAYGNNSLIIVHRGNTEIPSYILMQVFLVIFVMPNCLKDFLIFRLSSGDL